MSETNDDLVWLKTETYKKLQHDANITVKGDANIKDNGLGRTITVNRPKYGIACYTNNVNGVIVHTVMFNTFLKIAECTGLIANVYYFNNIAGDVTFFVPGGCKYLDSSSYYVYWRSDTVTGYDVGTTNFKITTSANNPDPVYDNSLVTLRIASNECRLVKTCISNKTGTMLSTEELVTYLPAYTLTAPKYTIIEGDYVFYDLNNLRISSWNFNNVSVSLTTGNDCNIYYDPTSVTYISNPSDTTGLNFVGFIRLKANRMIDDISRFKSPEQYRGATIKTINYIAAHNSNNDHIYFKYGHLWIDNGGRVIDVKIDADWTLII